MSATDNTYEDIDPNNFQTMMLSMGFKKPQLKTTQEMGLTPEELEKKQNEFITKKFDNTPWGILLTTIDSQENNTIQNIKKKILDKMKELDVEGRKKLLIAIMQGYHENRKKIYITFNQFVSDSEESSEYFKQLGEQIVHLINQNIAVREIFNILDIEIDSVTDTHKFNKFSTEKDFITLAGISYLRSILMPCPKCGEKNLIKAVDFSNLFQENSNAFINSLHGKLLQDCPSCDWYFFYDIDVLVAEGHHDKKIISEETKLKLRDGSVRKNIEGKQSRKSQQFFLPMVGEKTREALLDEWKSLIGGNKIPEANPQFEGRLKFSNKSYILKEGKAIVSGVEVGPIINNSALVIFYFN